MKNLTRMIAPLLISVAFHACKKSDSTEETQTPTTTTDQLTLYKKVYGASSEIYKDGDYVVIKTTTLPDHKSPYYKGTEWEASKWEDYNGTNSAWNQNPNKIASASVTFKLPYAPKEAATKSATPMGPIGIALNGVPFFNQYAAGGSPLTGEINSFDQYLGHPQQQGMYHYHIEPVYLTKNKGQAALLGFLMDGFPVYGPVENGKTLVSSDLDDYHGHTGVTAEYPKGTYHYHITADAPYLNGDGFYGTPGTVTQ